jgi:hypothetical protein
MAGFGSARSSNFPDENQIAGWSAVSFSIPSALSRPQGVGKVPTGW